MDFNLTRPMLAVEMHMHIGKEAYMFLLGQDVLIFQISLYIELDCMPFLDNHYCDFA